MTRGRLRLDRSRLLLAVPPLAFVTAFVLGLGTGDWTAAPAAEGAEGTSENPPAPVPEPGSDRFRPAADGRPAIVLVGVQGDDPPAGAEWFVVAKPSGGDQFSGRGAAGPVSGDRTRTSVPVVDQLVCVSVGDGLSVAVPKSAPDLTDQLRAAPGAEPAQPGRVACRGGWSVASAVPDVVVFEWGRSS